MANANQTVVKPRPRGGMGKRLASVILPAAAATCVLFLGMDRLVSVDEVSFAERQRVTLDPITPSRETDNGACDGRTPVELIETVSPPPQPRDRFDKGDPGSVAPAVYEVQQAPKIVAPKPDLIGFRPEMERPLRAIRPPAPVFPRGATASGTCEVRFDVDARGNPFNVTAQCSEKVFEREAIRGMRKAQFAPEMRGGEPVIRRNVVYPIEFNLDD